jgi:hypothetical protein
MIGIVAGLLTANAVEWLVHKYVLHGLGRKSDSFWNFHWREHHVSVRRHGFLDPDYARPLFGWHAQGKEALALAGGALLVLPLLPVAPVFTVTLWYASFNYYRRHKRAHCDVAWAREHLPWHYEHHMGPNPDANWGVTRPWFDVLLGTRERFLGTEAAAGL